MTVYFQVKEETTEYKEHFIRHLIAKLGNESRTLIHLHYQEWPDKGVPRCTAAILDLIDRFRNSLVLDKEKSPPALVHCRYSINPVMTSKKCIKNIIEINDPYRGSVGFCNSMQ